MVSVRGARVDIAPGFAASASIAQPHPTTAGGAALLYTAQSPAFINSVNPNNAAVTKDLPAVSLPLGISLQADLPTKQGQDLFSHDMRVDERLGPQFNEQSCSDCHNTPAAGGMGTDAQSFVTRIARIQNDTFDDLSGQGGPIARQRSIGACGIPAGVPPQVTATSLRSAMTLRGTALIDNILNSQILAAANDQTVPLEVRGRVNRLTDGRIGRFGWKAQTATLVEFMGQAFRDEMGVTNPMLRHAI